MTPTPPPHWLDRVPSPVVSVVLALAFLPLKLFGSTLSYLNIHAARDWERGWQLLRGVAGWWHGPELILRGAIPGFFFNALTGLWQIPHRAPEWAATGPPVLFAVSIAFFHDATRRLFGARAALWATLVYGAFPLGTIALRYLWNPSYLYLFTTLAFWCLARALASGRAAWAGWGFLPLLLAAQIHLSGYTATLGYAVALVLLRLMPPWRVLAAVLGIHALFLAPYYIDQALQGWPTAAYRRLTVESLPVRVYTVRPNPLFFPPLGLSLFVQPPGYPQTFPFSYFERYYQSHASHATLGMICFLLSLPATLLMAIGAGRALRHRPWGPAATPGHRLMVAALAVMAAVCLPLLLWNPRNPSAPDWNLDVPVRYFIIFWPAQFLLLAGGIDWMLRRTPRWSARVLLGPAVVVMIALVVSFHNEAARTGRPFNYLHLSGWPVHALRDKVALARHLVERHGVTEELLLTRVHTQDELLIYPEESLDYELRAALETTPNIPAPDPTLYYFIFKKESIDRLAGDMDRIEVTTFGSLGLLVYRPHEDLSDWHPDAPISWWWY